MKKNASIGEILVRNGTITTGELGDAVAAQSAHNIKLGEALVKIGSASEVDVRAALIEQKRLRGERMNVLQEATCLLHALRLERAKFVTRLAG